MDQDSVKALAAYTQVFNLLELLTPTLPLRLVYTVESPNLVVGCVYAIREHAVRISCSSAQHAYISVFGEIGPRENARTVVWSCVALDTPEFRHMIKEVCIKFLRYEVEPAVIQAQFTQTTDDLQVY